MLVRSKICPQFVEKIEELQPSLSKQLNKMLKIRSEMLKFRKNGKIIKLEKNSRKVFPNPGNSEDFRIPRIFQNFLENFLFPGKKGNPPYHLTIYAVIGDFRNVYLVLQNLHFFPNNENKTQLLNAGYASQRVTMQRKLSPTCPLKVC